MRLIAREGFIKFTRRESTKTFIAKENIWLKREEITRGWRKSQVDKIKESKMGGHVTHMK
jgi:hypothetical protein